jgi:hypothetical protein
MIRFCKSIKNHVFHFIPYTYFLKQIQCLFQYTTITLSEVATGHMSVYTYVCILKQNATRKFQDRNSSA